jgi:hypothetical protein
MVIRDASIRPGVHQKLGVCPPLHGRHGRRTDQKVGRVHRKPRKLRRHRLPRNGRGGAGSGCGAPTPPPALIGSSSCTRSAGSIPCSRRACLSDEARRLEPPSAVRPDDLAPGSAAWLTQVPGRVCSYRSSIRSKKLYAFTETHTERLRSRNRKQPLTDSGQRELCTRPHLCGSVAPSLQRARFRHTVYSRV